MATCQSSVRQAEKATRDLIRHAPSPSSCYQTASTLATSSATISVTTNVIDSLTLSTASGFHATPKGRTGNGEESLITRPSSISETSERILHTGRLFIGNSSSPLLAEQRSFGLSNKYELTILTS
ncbi:unnamed protein product [Protopolystoma xenopodis]|uniref:Uncharacterized protein n=1 Tax=Protopolystoma xenopodis TaxID=117903 RepID=A0A3S5CCG2_9PLAT|nr:unnamed protein product [Protopolystoma xenopodis]